MLKKIKLAFVLAIARLMRRFHAEIEQDSLPQFAGSPKNLSIKQPLQVRNAHLIEIGNDVDFGPGCFLSPITRYPIRRWAESYGVEQTHFQPKIIIGSRVSATGNVTISACLEVVLEDDVMLASNIFISDATHGYDTVDIPFKYQPLQDPKKIVIGKGSWIGQNCVIAPGVIIGEYCIIGANSVVLKSLPARTIAVGAPARIIKTWDDTANKWISASDA